MTTKKISVITPSFNQGEYIEETIQSILNQGYGNFEHIVVDGGSTDQTLTILSKYPHVRWISEPDSGQAHAINKGILMSSGDIISYLNSDDVYRPGAFQHVIQAFSGDEKHFVVVGDCDAIDRDSRIIGSMEAQYDGNYLNLLRYWGWMKWYCIPQPAVFMDRRVFAAAGLFDTSYHYVLDYDMWLRITKLYPIKIMNETLAAFRLRPHSKTGSQLHNFYREEFHASRKYWPAMSSSMYWKLLFEACGHVSNKFLELAESEAMYSGSRRAIASRLLTSFAYKPWVALTDPRFLLTAIHLMCKRSRFESWASRMQKGYARWRENRGG